MNKKINDIGYFIFGIVILFLFVINSISETVGSITGDENKKIISYIILGIIGFLLMIFLLKAYLLNTNQIIINMKVMPRLKRIEKSTFLININHIQLEI